MFKPSTAPAATAANPNNNSTFEPSDDEIQEFDTSKDYKPHSSAGIP